MKEIHSTHNKAYRHLRQLATRAKYRREVKQTILEGIHLCQSYLEHGGRPVMCVYTDHAKEHQEAKAIIDSCDDRSVPCMLLSESNFRSISGVEHGIGLMFVIDIPTPSAPDSLQAHALLLEDVQDPGNMGTMLRTAAAAGIAQVYASSGSVSAWSPKVLRAGMGAHFALTVYEQCDLAEVIRSAQVPVLATSLRASESIYEKDLSGPVAWLFGNEGNGVSEALMALDVQQVTIPQNHRVESLNVAASAAICLFEQLRQSTSTNIH